MHCNVATMIIESRGFHQNIQKLIANTDRRTDERICHSSIALGIHCMLMHNNKKLS